MSRIDISIRDKASGTLIANRGFCRNSHLSFFCEESQDATLRDFANDLFMGVDITEKNIEDFLKSIEYVVSYLERLDKNDRNKAFPFYTEELYTQFLNDLKDGLEFLQSLNKTQDIQKLEIEII
ncbi:MAG: hypothetical protein ACXWE9_01025 [Methylobacter sp.]